MQGRWLPKADEWPGTDRCEAHHVLNNEGCADAHRTSAADPTLPPRLRLPKKRHPDPEAEATKPGCLNQTGKPVRG